MINIEARSSVHLLLAQIPSRGYRLGKEVDFFLSTRSSYAVEAGSRLVMNSKASFLSLLRRDGGQACMATTCGPLARHLPLREDWEVSAQAAQLVISGLGSMLRKVEVDCAGSHQMGLSGRGQAELV